MGIGKIGELKGEMEDEEGRREVCSRKGKGRKRDGMKRKDLSQ